MHGLSKLQRIWQIRNSIHSSYEYVFFSCQSTNMILRVRLLHYNKQMTNLSSYDNSHSDVTWDNIHVATLNVCFSKICSWRSRQEEHNDNIILMLRAHLRIKAGPVRATSREIEWDVAISWQLRGLCGCYGFYGCYKVCVPLLFANIASCGSCGTNSLGCCVTVAFSWMLGMIPRRSICSVA